MTRTTPMTVNYVPRRFHHQGNGRDECLHQRTRKLILMGWMDYALYHLYCGCTVLIVLLFCALCFDQKLQRWQVCGISSDSNCVYFVMISSRYSTSTVQRVPWCPALGGFWVRMQGAKLTDIHAWSGWIAHPHWALKRTWGREQRSGSRPLYPWWRWKETIIHLYLDQKEVFITCIGAWIKNSMQRSWKH